MAKVDWIKLQENKYSDPSKGFGEADKVVDLNLKAYQKLKSLAKPNMKFLDLGTNSGRVAYEMKKLGLLETGVDLPAVVAKIKYPILLFDINLEEEFPTGTWDLVFCRELIEHLRNYNVVCKKIINCLEKDTGRLVITAPFDERDMGKNCPEHTRVFKNKELDKLVEDSGGEIIEAFCERRQRVVVARRK